MKTGEILLSMGRLTEAGLENALARQQAQPHGQKQKIGAILLAEGSINEGDLLAALARQFGLTYMEQVDVETLDVSPISDVPFDWARSRNALACVIEGQLTMLTADPARIADLDDLTLLLGDEPVPVLVPASVVSAAIEQCYFHNQSGTSAMEDMQAESGAEPEKVAGDEANLLSMSDAAPAARWVNVLLLDGVRSRASDIHIEPFQDRLVVRFRIDGRLYEQESPPKKHEAAIISRLKVMGHLDIAEKRLPQDGTARMRIGDRDLDVRLSTLPVAEGERMVLRILQRGTAQLPLTDLGMEQDTITSFRELLEEPNGAIWVTGPTGSGKTTTLYTALRELDTRHQNILTIEDPVEYQLPDIGQLAVKPKIGLSFAQGLRHILRQDPDIILVGETRDEETAEIVVRASLTGHLVFSTLHTNDAASALIRLVDMGVEPYLAASATRACMAQRLLRKLCPACRVQAGDDREMGRRLEQAGKPMKAWYSPGGCEQCREGYRGRTAIFELFRMQAEIEDALRKGSGLAEIRRLMTRSGSRTLMEDGLLKVERGDTSPQELFRAVSAVI